MTSHCTKAGISLIEIIEIKNWEVSCTLSIFHNCLWWAPDTDKSKPLSCALWMQRLKEKVQLDPAYSNSIILNSPDDFLVFKDIRSDVIEKHLAASLWLEMSILIYKRFTTAIGSPVACLSPSIAFVARPVVTSFSCYNFTGRNCENPTVLLFHGWFSNWAGDLHADLSIVPRVPDFFFPQETSFNISEISRSGMRTNSSCSYKVTPGFLIIGSNYFSSVSSSAQ